MSTEMGRPPLGAVGSGPDPLLSGLGSVILSRGAAGPGSKWGWLRGRRPRCLKEPGGWWSAPRGGMLPGLVYASDSEQEVKPGLC